MASKELRVEITGNANQLGAEAKKAQGYIDDLKRGGLNVLTAGAFAGGVTGAIALGMQALTRAVSEIRSVMDRAEKLNVSTATVRQLKAFGKMVGAEDGTIDSSVQQVRQSRSDALAGDDAAGRSFERLGISLREIAEMKPDEIFHRVLDAFSAQELTAQRYYDITKIIGEDAAKKLGPFAVNPRSIGLARDTADRTADYGWFMRLLASPFTSVIRGAVRRRSEPFEPFSTFGLSQEEQARDMATQNQVKLNQATRAQLSDEERINQALAERLRLITLIEAERDPVKRQKLLASAIQVENELGALAGKSAGGSGGSGGAFSRSNDSLRAIGADLSRFGPSLATRLQEQTNTEIRNMKQTLDQGLRRIEQELQRDL
jgi:hypothetical protein